MNWQQIKKVDLIVTTLGQPHIIKASRLSPTAIIIDMSNQYLDQCLIGDIDLSLYQNSSNLTITPLKEGLSPLVACVLFDNLINSLTIA